MSPTTGAPTLLCFDIGLTNVKAVLIADDGTVVGLTSQRYPTVFGVLGQADQDPDDWWRAIGTAAAELAITVGPLWRTVAGIAVTAHMHGLVGLDKAGRPVGPALVLGDRRAAEDSAAITSVLGEATIHGLTGSTMDATMPAAKIRWIRRCQPERYAATAMFTSVKDEIRGRLVGGDRWTEPIDACATALWDIHGRRWSEAILELVAVEPDRLPDVIPATTATQFLTQPAARYLGLPVGVPVVVGAGDDIEVLGCGLIEPGGALEHLGTTGSILKVIGEPLHDPALALELYPHAIDGLWVTGGSMTTAGAAIDWAAGLQRLAHEPASDQHAGQLDAQNDPLTLDDPIFLPGLAGERCPARNPDARGAWLGLSLQASRATLAAAVHEGVGFALRRIIDATDDLTGPTDRLIVSAGGGAAAPSAVQSRADLYGRTLTLLATPEPTALGLAVVVAVGIGRYETLEAASTAMVPRGRPVYSDPGNASVVLARYARFRLLADELDPVW